MGRLVWVGHWVRCLCGWVVVFMWVRWLWFVGVAMGVFMAMARVGFMVVGVNTVFCLPLICMSYHKNSKNINFLPWNRRNIWIDVAQPVQTSEHSKCHFRSNWPKCLCSTLSWPEVKVGQNHPKTTFFMFLHQTWATWWFLLTWTKFDPRLTP